MLVRLLYVSRFNADSAPSVVDAIIKQSRQHNPAHGITGVLCHTGTMFIQILEGGRDAINKLYNRINCDDRHYDVMLLDYAEISERRFAEWTMGRVNLDKVNASMLLKYSEHAKLDPYRLPGKVSLALLDELLSSAAVLTRPESKSGS